MTGRKDVSASQQRQDDGWVSDTSATAYPKRHEADPSDQPTMPLSSPNVRASRADRVHDYYQADEFDGSSPMEPLPRQRSTFRQHTHPDQLPDDWEPAEPRHTRRAANTEAGSSEMRKRRQTTDHVSKRGKIRKQTSTMPTFGGGVRGRFLSVTGFGGLFKRTRQGLPPQTLKVLRRRAILTVVLTLLVLSALSGTVDAAIRISRTRSDASAAMLHVHNIQSLVPSDDLGKLLDPATLQRIKQELLAAQRAFASLYTDLADPGGTFFIAAYAPVTGSILQSGAALANAAIEACYAGLDLVNSAQMLTSVLKAGFFASSSTNATAPPSGTPPALNATILAQLQHNIENALSHLGLAVSYAQSADLSVIPSSLLKPKQVDQIHQLLTNWPQIQAQLAEVDIWVKAAPALLGVTAPENFLIELMDRSELRSTGGFIGNYAVMTLKNGQIEPFTLRDTYLLDEPFIKQQQLNAPSQYPWWPFPDFGLRDTNISANFPTAAQAGITFLKMEGGGTVQGVIALTPPTIARILKIIGPIYVSDYKETVTDKNLEQLIHYYQQTRAHDPVTNLPPSDQISSSRKNFTALLARAFIEKLHGLPTSKLVDIVKAMMTSLQTKDLQMYLSDKTVEALLAKHHMDGSITQGPGDGVTIVDANVGVNKGSQFTVASYTDHISLDDKGTATHDLTITYNFKVTNPALLFGPDRYKTYLRVYAPANAKLLSLSGLVFGNNELNTSDEPGRQMWGGYVNVPDGQPYTLHIVWSVANAATLDQSGRWQYQIVFQHQAGSNQQLTLTITEPGAKKPAFSHTATLNEDKIYSVTYAQ